MIYNITNLSEKESQLKGRVVFFLDSEGELVSLFESRKGFKIRIGEKLLTIAFTPKVFIVSTFSYHEENGVNIPHEKVEIIKKGKILYTEERCKGSFASDEIHQLLCQYK